MKTKQLNAFWDMGMETIKELETDKGILASDRTEIYGCIFGRDSLITSLKLLDVYRSNKNPYFLNLVKKVLENLFILQGKEVNIESGEEPGKCIHEYRTENHEHLTKYEKTPWYVYADGTMKNYDTADATLLLLITTYRYAQLSNDSEFIEKHFEKINSALDWILKYADSNKDGLLDYSFRDDRKYGGLLTQSWMDSSESLFHEDGSEYSYPIAPIEIQAYGYLTLKLWSSYFSKINLKRANELNCKAQELKKIFNEKYVIQKENGIQFAYAIDGNGKPFISLRSNIAHVLWAASIQELDGETDCILKNKFIPFLVKNIMHPDIFEPRAGIRTLGKNSIHYLANSYHNGSIWPHDNSMIIQGLENFGYITEAQQVRYALINAFEHFKTPIELFVFENEKFSEYLSPQGQKACKKQAWSTASMLCIGKERESNKSVK